MTQGESDFRGCTATKDSLDMTQQAAGKASQFKILCQRRVSESIYEFSSVYDIAYHYTSNPCDCDSGQSRNRKRLIG
jgi:hypothetical protein